MIIYMIYLVARATDVASSECYSQEHYRKYIHKCLIWSHIFFKKWTNYVKVFECIWQQASQQQKVTEVDILDIFNCKYNYHAT